MTDDNQSGDSKSVPPPDIESSNETDPAERPGQPRGKIHRFLEKVTSGAINTFSHSKLKGSHSRPDSHVPPKVDCKGASSIPNIKAQDAPSGADQGTDP